MPPRDPYADIARPADAPRRPEADPYAGVGRQQIGGRASAPATRPTGGAARGLPSAAPSPSGPSGVWDRVNGMVNAAGQGITDTVVGMGRMIANPTGAQMPNALQQPIAAAEAATPYRPIVNVPRYQPRDQTEANIQHYSGYALNALAPETMVGRLGLLGTTVAGAAGGRAVGGDVGEVIGSMIGGGIGARPRAPRPRGPATPAQEAATGIGGRRVNITRARAEAERLRAQNIQPTAADVVGTGARRRIRDVATRSDDAQTAALNYRVNRASGLPTRMSDQSRRLISNDPRTPDQIRTEITTRRNAQAATEFGAVRGDTMTMAPETVTALRSDYGRAAIREAARRENDPEVRAALLRLADDALDNPNTPVTVGMMDRISRVLLSQAEEARARPDADLASTLGSYGRNVRNPTRAASPGYGDALDNYAAESRLNDAATHGENFMTRNTDEFVAGMANMGQDERAMAQAAARRAVERASGESLGGAAPTVATNIASREQHMRNVALLGEDGARALEEAMAAEAQVVRGAAEIDPRIGSQTQPNQMVAAGNTALDVVGAAGALTHANPVPMGRLALGWLQTLGMNEAQATRILATVTDPNQTDAVLAAIERAQGPGARQAFLDFVQSPQVQRQLAISGSVALGSQQGQ